MDLGGGPARTENRSRPKETHYFDKRGRQRKKPSKNISSSELTFFRTIGVRPRRGAPTLAEREMKRILTEMPSGMEGPGVTEGSPGRGAGRGAGTGSGAPKRPSAGRGREGKGSRAGFRCTAAQRDPTHLPTTPVLPSQS